MSWLSDTDMTSELAVKMCCRATAYEVLKIGGAGVETVVVSVECVTSDSAVLAECARGRDMYTLSPWSETKHSLSIVWTADGACCMSVRIRWRCVDE